MAKKGKELKSIVHEVSDHRHRIVVLHEDGTNTVGNWAELREVAFNGGYFAITGESPLPQGIFTCRDVPHQVLN